MGQEAVPDKARAEEVDRGPGPGMAAKRVIEPVTQIAINEQVEPEHRG